MKVLQRILITGAAGVVGTALRRGLGSSYELRGLDRRRGREWRRGDLTRPLSVRKVFEGVDAVVDLAANPSLHSSWDEVWEQNVPATIGALEAARAAGVRRVVFASSAHVVGLYEREQPYSAIVAGEYEGLDPEAIPKITRHHPVRPDTPYAVGKVAGEAAGRYYSEQHGLSVICLRLGWVTADDVPAGPRGSAAFLSHADLTHLVDCCLRAPDNIRFAIYFGVSANTWRLWDIEDARREIGYEPKDNGDRLQREP
jgi:nucleoside-diphosphate-sugar epimerase